MSRQRLWTVVVPLADNQGEAFVDHVVDFAYESFPLRNLGGTAANTGPCEHNGFTDQRLIMVILWANPAKARRLRDRLERALGQPCSLVNEYLL